MNEKDATIIPAASGLFRDAVARDRHR